MPSFDIVSEIDNHELQNAVDQANRMIGQRYDFRGSDARIERQPEQLRMEAENPFQLQQMRPILDQQLARRGIDVRALSAAEVQQNARRAWQEMPLLQGIDRDLARQLCQLVKRSGLKLQAAIQGDRVRISGSKRDDLQRLMTELKDGSFARPLQFCNRRD